MRTIMLPISIGSSFFRSERYSKFLSSVPSEFNVRFFFVADQLQIYNRALLGDGLAIGQKLTNFYETKDYLEERRQWIRRLSKHPGLSWAQSCDVEGVTKFTDSIAWRALRNVRILYYMDIDFRRDVDSWSGSYSGHPAVSEDAAEVRRLMSVSFVLEEIALNLRIRIIESIDAEFYPGGYPTALPAIYAGKYSASAAQLIGVAPKISTFQFFSLDPDDDNRWVEVGALQSFPMQKLNSA